MPAMLSGGIPAAFAAPPFTQQGPKLTATDEIGNGGFGWSAALSADGNTALIAAPSDDSAWGAAWVFTRAGATWTQQAKFARPTGETANGNFGTAVALSADGNTALVGASFDGSPSTKGAAWVFTRSGSTWTQQGGKIQPTDAVGNGQFGLAVSLSADGNTAAIGAPLDNGNVGAGWIFTRSGATWIQQGLKLTGAGGVGSSFFGRSAALSGDGNTVVFGGPQDGSAAGAAWVFTRSTPNWAPQGAKLIPSDGVGAPEFGGSASMSSDGNTALVGGGADGTPRGAGAAWVFTRSGTTWAQQGSKLQPSDQVGKAFFGNGSLSSDGNTALIAGLNDNAMAGAAWIFTRSGTVWTQQGSKLTGSGAAGNATMGDSAALSADASTALIGGTRDNGRIGAAWVFSAPTATAPTPAVADGTAPTSSLRSGCTRSRALTATVRDNAGGTGAKAIHYRLNGGPERLVATHGNPGMATISLPRAGSYRIQFWGEDVAGNQQALRRTVTVVFDNVRPAVSIRSDQRRNAYLVRQFASVTIVARDRLSGLAANPSRRRVRLSTARPGTFLVRRTARDRCGNVATATFRYRVRRAAIIVSPRFTG